jgi:hypothetical protein
MKVRRLTIEKRVEVVEVHLAKLEKVFAGLRAVLDFQVDYYVAEGCFEQHRHKLKGVGLATA